MIKKILSLLLCLSMLAGSIVTTGITVAADESEAMVGSTEYATLEEALEGARNGDVVVLLKDVQLEATQEITKTLTLRSEGGYKVTSDTSVFNVSGALTLMGVSVGGVEVSGGTFTMRDSTYASYVNISGGVFNFYGGTVGSDILLKDSTALMRMSGGAELESGSVIMPSTSYIEITGELTGSSKITVRTDSVAQGNRIATLSGITLTGSALERFTVYDGSTEYTVIVNGNDLVVDKAVGNNDVARIGEVTYPTLKEAFDAAAAVTNATVTLISNANVTESVTVKGNVTLEADGNYTVYTSSAIVISKGASLTISDADNSICVSGSSSDNGSALFDVQGTLTTSASVSLTGNVNTSESVNKGVVYVNGGTFNMKGGAITENTSKSGTVYIASGSFNMSGGVINNNKASVAGGVYVAGGSFSLSGGSIYANSGDAVWNAGSFALSGSGTIYSSATYPATLFLSSGTKVKVSSQWKPSAAPDGYSNIIPVAATEPKLYDVIAEFDGAASADHFKMSDRYENKFALMPKDKTLIIAAADDVYTVYWGNNPYMSLEEAVAALPENTAATLKIVGDTVVNVPVIIKKGMNVTVTTDANPANMADYTQRTVKRGASFTDAIFRVEAGATLILSAADGKSLVFDGENKVAKSAMVITSGGVVVGKGVKLTANSNKAAEKLGGTSHVMTFGGGVYVEKGGSLSVNGGIIAGNYATYGGGIYINDGAVNLSEGEITGNSALYGAGVYLETSGSDENVFAVFSMVGGNLSANKATESKAVKGSGVGGGVYVGNGSKFMLSGGSVHKNTAALASGVCVGTLTYAEKIPVPQMILSDKAKIASENNIYLSIPNISYILVTSNLTAQSGSFVISIPSAMPQNMILVKFGYGDKANVNEAAAENALKKKLFSLDKTASEYFAVGASQVDRSMLINTAGDNLPSRTKAGKHHNGLALYLEDEAELKEGETRTPVVYNPVTVRPNGSFTTYYEMSYYPNLYKNINTAITAPFPEGTRIVMIDTTDEKKIGYYYYEVSGDESVVLAAEAENGKKTPDVIEIPLTSFYKMGTKDIYYEAHVSTAPEKKAVITEKMLFVVDFTDVKVEEGVTLEGEFSMVWNHYYPGSVEGERYDISANATQSVYTVSAQSSSTVTLTTEGESLKVSYTLGTDSTALASGDGVILFQLGQGSFQHGSVLTDTNGNSYVSANSANSIAVPLPKNEAGELVTTGEFEYVYSNYYGTALVNATLRCVILASDDGVHPAVGGVYDAESEGVRFETKAQDEYSILVTTLDGEKKPYYESYEILKENPGLQMNVKGLVNTVEIDTFNLSLLKKEGDKYIECSLSELFSVSEEYGYEIILNTGTLDLELTSNIDALIGNEYKVVFKVGDAVEYVKVNVIKEK